MDDKDILKALKVVSTVAVGQFAGSAACMALIIQPSLIEQPDVQSACKTMRSLLKRCNCMPLLALLSSATSLAAYYKAQDDRFWLTSGSLMIAMVPYTIATIKPINVQFCDEDEEFDNSSNKWSDLLSKWLTLHTPRALFASTLFAVAVYKLSA